MKDLKTYYGLFRDWHCYVGLVDSDSQKAISEITENQFFEDRIQNQRFDTIIFRKQDFFYMKDCFGLEYGTYIHSNDKKHVSFDDFLGIVKEYKDQPLELFKKTNIEMLDSRFETEKYEDNEILISYISDILLIFLKNKKLGISISKNENLSTLTPLNGECSPKKQISKIVCYNF